MNVRRFITVVQRRELQGDDAAIQLLEPLFAIETHMSFEERMFLLSAAEKMPPGFVACEIGSYVGASTSFLAMVARSRGGRIHCIDTWDNREMGPEKPRDTLGEFSRNTPPFRDWIVMHQGASPAMADAVPRTLDLLFIDGDHSYAAVRSDLASYAPKLKPGGMLLLHDYGFASVRQACTEYLVHRPAKNLGNTHSLQVFQVLDTQ